MADPKPRAGCAWQQYSLERPLSQLRTPQPAGCIYLIQPHITTHPNLDCLSPTHSQNTQKALVSLVSQERKGWIWGKGKELAWRFKVKPWRMCVGSDGAWQKCLWQWPWGITRQPQESLGLLTPCMDRKKKWTQPSITPSFLWHRHRTAQAGPCMPPTARRWS